MKGGCFLLFFMISQAHTQSVPSNRRNIAKQTRKYNSEMNHLG